MNRTYLDIEFCKEGRFGGVITNTTDPYGMIDNFLCLKDDFNIDIYGSYETDLASFLGIEINYC